MTTRLSDAAFDSITVENHGRSVRVARGDGPTVTVSYEAPIAFLDAFEDRDWSQIGDANVATAGLHLRISLSPRRNGIDLVRAKGPAGDGTLRTFHFMNASPRRGAAEELYEYIRSIDDARHDLENRAFRASWSTATDGPGASLPARAEG